jgi:cytochrome c heme-lyase
MLMRRAAVALALAGGAAVYSQDSRGKVACLPGMSNSSGIIPDNCPMSSNYKKKVPPPPPPPPAPSSSECPSNVPPPAAEGSAQGEKYVHPVQYNVYSEPIDPKNNMPATANQEPAPGQRLKLNTERVKSSIPKAGTDDGTWVYPSPQMFWNALVRKNKVEGASEEDMENVIAVHNSMNETTWAQIMAWEALHVPTGPGREAKLSRFTGKPDDLSPKAKLRQKLGMPIPFDRHDWIVDRGGVEVRYIIDYYHDESNVDNDDKPKDKSDFHAVKSIFVDVRPALDSFDAVLDRVVRMPLLSTFGDTKYKPVPLFFDPKIPEAEKRKKEVLRMKVVKVDEGCSEFKLKIAKAAKDQNEQEFMAAVVAGQRCMAKYCCPHQLAALDTAVAAKPFVVQDADLAYERMKKCLELFAIELKNANIDPPFRN